MKWETYLELNSRVISLYVSSVSSLIQYERFWAYYREVSYPVSEPGC